MSDAVTLSRQRCFHHPAREAVCRCMQCSRSFCRECVVDHDGRLVCSTCLAGAPVSGATSNRGRRWRAIVAGAAGFVAAWACFYLATQFVVAVVLRWNDWGDQ
jgi:hypothetical protein